MSLTSVTNTMGQFTEQISSSVEQDMANQREQLFMSKLQAARQSAIDRKANVEQELAEYEAEIAARTPQAEQPTEAQPLDEYGNPVPLPEAQG